MHQVSNLVTNKVVSFIYGYKYNWQGQNSKDKKCSICALCRYIGREVLLKLKVGGTYIKSHNKVLTFALCLLQN